MIRILNAGRSSSYGTSGLDEAEPHSVVNRICTMPFNWSLPELHTAWLEHTAHHYFCSICVAAVMKFAAMLCSPITTLWLTNHGTTRTAFNSVLLLNRNQLRVDTEAYQSMECISLLYQNTNQNGISFLSWIVEHIIRAKSQLQNCNLGFLFFHSFILTPDVLS